MTRVKTFDATGVAPSGVLYAGDLNSIQDHYADQTNLSQNVGVGTLTVGESALQITRYGLGILRISGQLRVDSTVNTLTGYQVNGIPLAASHLSDGVVGTGQIAKVTDPTFGGVPQAPTAPSGTNTDQIATTAFVHAAVGVAGTGVVNSVFGRSGVVTALSGDYTAAQVTNAADKSSAAQQAFSGLVTAPSITAGGTLTATTVNAVTQLQVSGTALAASHLSNGVTGSGQVVLNTSPSLAGTLSVPAISVASSLTVPTATVSGTLTVTGAGGLGFGAGAGGSNSCAVNGSTTVNAPSGQVSSTGAIAASGQGYFTVVNSTVAATDGILVTLTNGTTTYSLAVPYDICVTHVSAGQFTIFISNNTSTAIAPVFNFQVINGSTT